jgi:hypothetical protein
MEVATLYPHISSNFSIEKRINAHGMGDWEYLKFIRIF